MKKIFNILICLLLTITLTGCNNTGISNNEAAIKALAENDTLIDIVIDDEHYTIGDTLSQFVDNGWSVQEATLAKISVTNLAEINLGAREYIRLPFEKNNRKLILDIVNFSLTEPSNILQGTVFGITTDAVKERFEEFIVIEGIVIGTSIEKAEQVLNEHNVHFENTNGSIIIEENDDDTRILKMTNQDDKVGQFVLTIDGIPLPLTEENMDLDPIYHYTEYQSPEQKKQAEAEFIATANIVEGTIVDEYKVIYNNSDAEVLIPIIATSDGTLYGISFYTGWEADYGMQVNIGDKLTVYYQYANEIILSDNETTISNPYGAVIIINDDHKITTYK